MEQAVRTLYLSADPLARQAAEKYLEQFQQSKDALDQCEQILSAPMEHTTPELRFLAAHTIRNKVHRDKEMEPTMLLAIPPRLVHHARVYAREGPVLAQLALGLPAVALRCPVWTPDAIVPDTLRLFGVEVAKGEGGSLMLNGCPEGIDGYVLLEFLTTLASESQSANNPQSRRLPMGRREATLASLSNWAPAIFQLITQLCVDRDVSSLGSGPDVHSFLQHLQCSGLKCAARWVEMDGVAPQILLSSQPLMGLVVSTSSQPNMAMDAIDAFSAAVKKAGADVGCVEPTMVYLSSILDIYRAARERGDDQHCRTLSRAFVQVGKAQIPNLVSGSDQGGGCLLQLADLLLQFLLDPDTETVAVFFTFWCNLKDAATAQYGQQDNHLEPYFLKAIESVVLRTRFSDTFSQWGSDAHDSFVWFRKEARDVIRHLATGRTVHSERQLLGALAGMVEDSVQRGPEGMWTLEATLHAVSTLAKWIPEDEEPYLSSILQRLPTLPTHPALVRTNCLLISVYVHWLARHPDLISPMVCYVLQALMVPEEDPIFPMRDKEDHVGAVAFHKLTSGLAPAIGAIGLAGTIVDEIQAVIGLVYDNVPPVMTCKSLELVMIGLGRIVSTMDTAAAAAAFDSVLSLCFSRLYMLVSRQQGDHSSHLTVPSLCSHISGFLSGCRFGPATSAGANHPVVVFFQREWQRVTGLLEMHLSVAEDTEAVCAVLKNILDATRDTDAIDAVVPPVQEQLTRAYASTRYTCVLSVFQVFPAVCSKRPALQDAINANFHYVLSLLADAYVSATEEGSEMVEALCKYFTSVATHTPHLLASPQPMSAFIHFLAAGTSQEYRPGGFAVLSLVEHLCQWVTSSQSGEDSPTRALGHMAIQVLQGEGLGSVLVRGLLGAANGNMPSWMLDNIVSALYSILRAFPGIVFAVWLREAISEEGFPRPKTTAEAKERFVLQLMQESSLPDGKKRFKACIKSFCGGKKKGSTGMPPR